VGVLLLTGLENGSLVSLSIAVFAAEVRVPLMLNDVGGVLLPPPPPQAARERARRGVAIQCLGVIVSGLPLE
jgi:hypothetical protein